MSIKHDSRNEISINFGGHELLLIGLKILFCPAKKWLIVADMHLEKGSYFAKKGNPLPLYDTLDTLKRLKEACAFYKPSTVISLGDNIHDYAAFQRMDKSSLNLLQNISASLETWFWIIGNHDSQKSPQDLGEKFIFVKSMQIDNIVFSHDFLQQDSYQIIGHYHPEVSIQGIRGKCFLRAEKKLILPSFGSYTGGLDITSINLDSTFSDSFSVYMVYKEKIWQIR